MTDRDRKLTIRVSNDELAMLEALAEADGLSASDIIRQYIRRSHAARFSDQKAKAR